MFDVAVLSLVSWSVAMCMLCLCRNCRSSICLFPMPFRFNWSMLREALGGGGRSGFIG